MKKLTEMPSPHRHLEKMSSIEIVQRINSEDEKIAAAVHQILPSIAQLLDLLIPKVAQGGRLFYIGAGTSGRLGILDASECPPTFGVSDQVVIGLIAGGDSAIRKAVENAEDDYEGAQKDLKTYEPSSLDSLVGLAASGTTPYVVGGLKWAQNSGMLTACITCNPDSPVTKYSDFPLVAEVGPEFLTGSTRMKSGTAQKMILNMISTGLMIGLGRVQDNRMVDMQLSNAKLVDRGTRMIMDWSDLEYDEARDLLLKHGAVREAIMAYRAQKDPKEK